MERIYDQEIKKIERVKIFLNQYHLKLDEHLDELYYIEEKGEIIATGGISGSILKCIAVKENDTNIINKVMSHLINRAYSLGYLELFIYTKPDTYSSFEYFGFKKIAQTPNLVLMENSTDGIEKYKRNLLKDFKEGDVGAVVVNCNPFTLGHRYLIEYAASHVDHLHVFVVTEDASTFPTETRYKLIEKGVSDIENITLHRGENYIISSATFPSYFLKDDLDLAVEQARLDLNIFSEHIAKELNIKKRFVGEEPFNETTRKYNETMKEILWQYGIEVIEIPRKTIGETVVSASTVRKCLYEDDYKTLETIVPKSTYDYLCSGEAQEIINRIKVTYNINLLV